MRLDPNDELVLRGLLAALHGHAQAALCSQDADTLRKALDDVRSVTLRAATHLRTAEEDARHAALSKLEHAR